ncbi:hypothetical protein RhiirA4_425359 [Rhizophagus irregularis]|uniref:Uncharacterized protein n=1 Tax=Rhizophagus irregularis TaxID=588596 RepID=A0A2I1H0X8_9GLOM|nr:hypothetical protein RhiirA4_425359 [Rhizophagus irregularis]
MPKETCPLVSISSNIANLESRSWLKSALWCLSQLFDPFHQFQYTWMDLKRMGLVPNAARTPSWFKEISSVPNVLSLLPPPISGNACITPSLTSLIGKFVDKVDEVAHIRLRNKYYWIAGLDSSDSLIFGRAFYTLDDDTGCRVIYFSHWIPADNDRMQITPCPGCALNSLSDNDGPLALKSVGGKLIHRSCLSILPSYRCLNLYQMTSHIDISQQFINLKLSPFILCSYFRFLLGYCKMYIPEQFLITDIFSLQNSGLSALSPLNPFPDPRPAFAQRSGTTFHIVSSVHKMDSLNSYLVCAWVQILNDLILDSDIFSCPMVSPYNDVAELTLVLYVLNSLPLDSSVEIVSFLQLDLSYSTWRNASPTKWVRLKNNFLWSCIHELLRAKQLSCRFIRLLKDNPDSLHLIRAQNFLKEPNWFSSLQPIPLLDNVFPFTLRTMGLFTGLDKLLTQDPIKYWRSLADIRRFFSLIGLSRFSALQTSFHSIDWSLTFDTFKQTLYLRLLVSQASTFLQFRLKLWFDELPIIYRLCQRFPGLYADDSLCPNCGIFMETLEHLFICSPSSLDVNESNPEPLQNKDITVHLLQRFLVKLATKISSSPRCKQTYDEILSALNGLDTIGLPSLSSDSTNSSFPASWFLRGFILRDLSSCLIRHSGLNYRAVSPIISRTFLKFQRELYHGLWRPRCKLKVQTDLAKGITPSILRSYKGPSIQPFRFSSPQVTLSPVDVPLSPLQTSEWASLGIYWLHSSLARRKTWFHHLSGFLKSRTVLIWNNILAVLRIG